MTDRLIQASAEALEKELHDGSTWETQARAALAAAFGALPSDEAIRKTMVEALCHYEGVWFVEQTDAGIPGARPWSLVDVVLKALAREFGEGT